MKLEKRNINAYNRYFETMDKLSIQHEINVNKIEEQFNTNRNDPRFGVINAIKVRQLAMDKEYANYDMAITKADETYNRTVKRNEAFYSDPLA